MKSSLVLFAFTLLVASFVAPATAQHEASDSSGVPPPWDLTHQEPGEPSWAPLLRIRDVESVYRESEKWWGIYAQLRAQAEAAGGNHAAALRFWDAPRRSRDSVGTLPEGVRAAAALNVLSEAADTARVIMINERHHAASDRLLTLRLLPILYEKGYRYFAAEALSYRDSTLNERTYPVDATGGYTDEPVFAAVIREALRLGYRLVPYEITDAQREVKNDLTRQQRRDRAQAQNLYDCVFRDDPDAKVLIHAGFGHIEEKASKRWHPMAVYFREITGIDPVTVDQTRLSERSASRYEHPAYRAAIAAGLLGERPIVLLDAAGHPLTPAEFAVDLQVLTPRTTYTAGRPDWMTLGGDRIPVDVAVPKCLNRWCFVRAHVIAEPAEAVPIDRMEVAKTNTVRLFLPPGEAIVRIFSADGKLLRRAAYEPSSPPKRE